MPSAPLSALKIDEWNQTVDVNINGVLNGVAAASPTFISQKSSTILIEKIIQSVPEYDDCVRLAKENGVSLADIFQSS